MGDYIDTPGFSVRFAKFDGDLNERAEEYIVDLNYKGIPKRINQRFQKIKGVRINRRRSKATCIKYNS